MHPACHDFGSLIDCALKQPWEDVMKKTNFAVILFVLSGIVLGCGGARGKNDTWHKGPMPTGGNFDGVYQSDFGRLELTVQYDGRVTGLYEDDEHSGRLEGTVDDNLLSFEWRQWNYEMRGKIRETRGKGVFQYIVENHESTKTKEYTRLAGWWGYSGGKMNNRWNSVKLSKRSQKRLKSFKPSRVIDQETEYQGTVGFPEE